MVISDGQAGGTSQWGALSNEVMGKWKRTRKERKRAVSRNRTVRYVYLERPLCNLKCQGDVGIMGVPCNVGYIVLNLAGV